MKFSRVALFFLMGAIQFSCGNSNSGTSEITFQEGDLVISNVSVITMKNETVLDNQDVMIRNGKIQSLNDAGSTKLPDDIDVIDGKGKYLIPGLAEMHAHIPGNRDMEYLQDILFLYLSNGVTTIRGMLGQYYHLELKELVDSGEILGPRIFTSSPSLNGNSVTTPEEAREKVTSYAADGYDFLKLHPGIQLEVFDTLVKVANEVGIKYSGHVSTYVCIRHALKSKYGSIDHVDGYLEGLVPEGANIDPQANGFFGFNFTYQADEDVITELSALTAENDVWVVPTQSLFERWAGLIPAEDRGSEPEMKYMPKETVENWVRASKNFQSQEIYDLERVTRFNEIRMKLIKSLHEEGVGLLLGSDAPQVFNVPGFSIHHELGYMVSAGLTAYDALEMGTVNPAVFFGMEGEFGVIKEGASADLILLSKNPLVDISNARDTEGVMIRGKWLSREYIKDRLEEIAAKNEE